MSFWLICVLARKPNLNSFDEGILQCAIKSNWESTAGTGHFYTTTKNKRTMPGKLEIKKFDPVARKHVIYKETKLK